MWFDGAELQATALLAGESGSNDLVRQYALRSLSDASKPEEVHLVPCTLDSLLTRLCSTTPGCIIPDGLLVKFNQSSADVGF